MVINKCLLIFFALLMSRHTMRTEHVDFARARNAKLEMHGVIKNRKHELQTYRWWLMIHQRISRSRYTSVRFLSHRREYWSRSIVRRKNNREICTVFEYIDDWKWIRDSYKAYRCTYKFYFRARREGNEIMSETADENQVYGPLSIRYIQLMAVR